MFLFFALHVQRLRLDLLFDVTGQAFVFIALVLEWLSCVRLLLLNVLGPGVSMFLITTQYWLDYSTMTVSVGNDFQKWNLRGCYMIRNGYPGFLEQVDMIAWDRLLLAPADVCTCPLTCSCRA